MAVVAVVVVVVVGFGHPLANLRFNMHRSVFEMQTLWLALGVNMQRWVFEMQSDGVMVE